MKSYRRTFLLLPALLSILLIAPSVTLAARGHDGGHHRSFLSSLAASPESASTVPASGDGNPYGVALVPKGFPSGGRTSAGDILVSNFNNGAGKQGEGTTIVSVTPSGAVSTFFKAPSTLGPVGLTTALVALRSGIVVVGNTPTTDGTPATVSDGSLIFLSRSGKVLLNLTSSTLLQGPWDMTATNSRPRPTLYVSDVLSGTVTRIRVRIVSVHGNPRPKILSMTQVASGFLHRTDPNALLVGPTGLLLSSGKNDGDNSGRKADRHGGNRKVGLYVADTGNNRLQFVAGVNRTNHDRGAGRTIVSGAPFEGPLALAWAPNGDIVASNGDAAGPPQTPSNINRVVEINPRNHSFVTSRQLDTSGTPGAIFGIAIGRVGDHESLIYVNDNTNTVDVLARH